MTSPAWPDAACRPRVRFDADGATLSHGLSGAPTLARLIESGSAAWAVELNCPRTLMARVDTCLEPVQRVEWRRDDVEGAVFLVPGVLTLEQLSRVGQHRTPANGRTGSAAMPVGRWLARGRRRRTIAVAPSESRGSRMNRLLIHRTSRRYEEWQRSCVFKQHVHGRWEGADPEVKAPVRRRQEELVAAVHGGADRLGVFLRQQLGLDASEQIHAPPFLLEHLSAGDLLRLSHVQEEELAGAWEGIPSRLASRPLFWFLCHVAWIEEGRFGCSGKRLAEAFLLRGVSPTREAMTRNFLRRTGGLAPIRGNVSVLTDCPLSRAWWRRRVAAEVERASMGRVTRATALRVLNPGPVWEQLATAWLRRAVVANQARGRAALVALLDRRLRRRGKLARADVKEALDEVARRGEQRSFAHTPLDELLD